MGVSKATFKGVCKVSSVSRSSKERMQQIMLLEITIVGRLEGSPLTLSSRWLTRLRLGRTRSMNLERRNRLNSRRLHRRLQQWLNSNLPKMRSKKRSLDSYLLLKQVLTVIRMERSWLTKLRLSKQLMYHEHNNPEMQHQSSKQLLHSSSLETLPQSS